MSRKTDDYDSKQRENDQMQTRIHELESIIKSLKEKHDLQNQWNAENEVNKLELKRKQDDYEQFQLVRVFVQKRNFVFNEQFVFFCRYTMQRNENIKKQFIYLK